MKNLFCNKISPYIIALILFVTLAVCYSLPALKGMKIGTPDNVESAAALHEANVFHEKTGDYTDWTGALFCGMPNYQIGGGTPTGKAGITTWLKDKLLLKGNAVVTVLFYFLCFFLMLLCFGINPWLSIAGAIAISLSSYFLVIIAAGHGGKCIVIPATALALGAFNLIFKREKRLLGALLTMLAISLGGTHHPQMTYYIYMMIGILWITELILHIKEKRVGRFAASTAVFAVSTIIGLGTSCAEVFTNSEFVKETIRGGHSEIVRGGTSEESDVSSGSKGLDIDYATTWSYGIDETSSLLIPGFMGGSSSYPLGTDSKLYKALVQEGYTPKWSRSFCEGSPLYWGEQPFTDGNVYVGAIIVFLFVFALLTVQGGLKWAFLAASILSVLLAWGYHFMWFTELFFNYFPLYNRFRTVSSILVVAEIAIPLLAFIGLNNLFKGNVEKQQAMRALCISLGVTLLFCLFFAISGPSILDFKSPYDSEQSQILTGGLYDVLLAERCSLMVSDCWRSIAFICAGFLLVLLYLKGRIRMEWTALVLALLVIADMWPVDRRYLSDRQYSKLERHGKEMFEPLPYEKSILQDKDPNFRVLNLASETYKENRTSYFFKSLGGYNAAKLRRYQDVIDEHLETLHLPVINMLNAKYIILPAKEGCSPEATCNSGAMGNCWFVDSMLVVDNATRECDALMEIDLHRTAVVDRTFEHFVAGINPSHDSSASIRLTKYTPRSLDYVSSSSRNGIAVFSEIYYPYGWKVYIDGQYTEHFRVNYILRALNVPSGVHNIHFEFDPQSIHRGKLVSNVFFILIYLTAAWLVVQQIVRRRRTKTIN